MSIVAFKKKSVINYGAKRSGNPPGGYWLPQGPFGHATTNLNQAKQNYGAAGFSINGGHRNVGYIGKDSKFSRNGTPFRGKHAYGNGGTFGNFYIINIWNVEKKISMGLYGSVSELLGATIGGWDLASGYQESRYVYPPENSRQYVLY